MAEKTHKKFVDEFFPLKDETKENQQRLVLTNLYNSRDDLNSTIVKIQCRDGHITAHKMILKAGSEYFGAMFRYNGVEDQTNVVSLMDVPNQVMDIIIKFIYGQEIPEPSQIEESVIQNILFTADKMQMNKLFDKYWSSYTSRITTANIMHLWQLAELFNKNETIGNIERFFLYNIHEMNKDVIRSKITAKQLKSILKVYATHAIKMDSNAISELVHFILFWEKQNTAEGENRQEDVVNFIVKCDLKNITDSSLRNFMRYINFFERSPRLLKLFIMEVLSRWESWEGEENLD